MKQKIGKHKPRAPAPVIKHHKLVKIEIVKVVKEKTKSWWDWLQEHGSY